MRYFFEGLFLVGAIIMLALFTTSARAQPEWSQPLWAQSTAGKLVGSPEEQAIIAEKQKKYLADKATCEAEAKKPQTVKHPGQVVGYDVAYERCMKRKQGMR